MLNCHPLVQAMVSLLGCTRSNLVVLDLLIPPPNHVSLPPSSPASCQAVLDNPKPGGRGEGASVLFLVTTAAQWSGPSAVMLPVQVIGDTGSLGYDCVGRPEGQGFFSGPPGPLLTELCHGSYCQLSRLPYTLSLNQWVLWVVFTTMLQWAV